MRRTSLSPRAMFPIVFALAVGFSACSTAIGDIAISIIDATGTARQDESLDGIGQTIFSADVFVEVPAGGAWFSGGLGLRETTRRPGVVLYYTIDPNTGGPIFTAPGYANDAEMFSTFVSYPLGQLQRERFTRPAALAGGYFGAPSPSMTSGQLEVSYYEYPTLFLYGSGFTQRVTISIADSAYAGQPVYVSAGGPAHPRDIRLVGFESAATTQNGEQRIQQWSFYTAPEPASIFLFAIVMFGGRLWRQHGLVYRRP